MPKLELIPEVYYQPTQQYHWTIDNLPLRAINDRIQLINSAVDLVSASVREATGIQGSLAARLDQTLDPSGDIKLNAVDGLFHNIANHSDGSISLSDDDLAAMNSSLPYELNNPVLFVRMLSVERAKLSEVATGATAFQLQVTKNDDTVVTFANDTVELLPSDTIQWRHTSPNQLQAELTFPTTAIHQHYYNITPVLVNLSTPDYKNYKVNSAATAFTAGSLRVYINGIRLSTTPSTVYAYGAAGPTGVWNPISYTENAANGLFTLSRAITSVDTIIVDFDKTL